MHAYLVTGNSPDKRLEAVTALLRENNVAPFRVLRTINDKASLGVEEIREITNLAKRIAGAEKQAIAIEDADRLTVVAQNAFLKTLEEPPKNTIIVLSAQSDDSFLPTILSRCLTLSSPPPAGGSQTPQNIDSHEEQERIFAKLRESGIGERIKFAEEIGKSREEAIKFVEGQLLFLHDHLKDTSKIKTTSDGGPERSRRNSFEVNKAGSALLSALLDLRHNVNPKMVLFELLKNY